MRALVRGACVRRPHDPDRPGRDRRGRDQLAGGSGTLITFPTLVTLGFPPVTATMSNAIGLVAGSVGNLGLPRGTESGQWDRLRGRSGPLTGAAIGAFLLLHLPEKVFTRVVPVLLVLALILVVIGPRIQAYARRRAEEAGRSAEHVSPARMAALVFGTFAVGVYGGYFTAAHPADRRDRGVAAGGHPADERGEEPVVAVGQRGGRGGLHAGGVRSDQLARGRGDRGRIAGRRVVGRPTAAGLSPNALRAVIVVVGLIGLYRLLSV